MPTVAVPPYHRPTIWPTRCGGDNLVTADKPTGDSTQLADGVEEVGGDQPGGVVESSWSSHREQARMVRRDIEGRKIRSIHLAGDSSINTG